MQTQHSSYWLDQDIFEEDEGNEMLRTVRLAATRRAIANFVSILSGQNIPVEFSSGQQSYTDGQRVVIAADDSPEKFDVMTGLALHEGSHVLLTDFDFVNQRVMAFKMNLASRQELAVNKWAPSVLGETLTQVLGTAKSIDDYYGVDEGYTLYREQPVWARGQTMIEHLMTLCNILEDRRIDKWVYTRAGGYRPYYDALYNRYFFTGEVGKNLRFNPKWRELTVENYLNRLLYAFHPASDRNALPGLSALIDMMDISTIERIAPENDPKDAAGLKWKGLDPVPMEWNPVMWQEAVILYSHILKFVSLSDLQTGQKDAEQGEGGESTDPGQQAKGMSDIFSDLPNLDLGEGGMDVRPVEQDTRGSGKNLRTVEGKYNEKKGEKELAEAKKVLTGELKKKKATKREQDAVKALEAADAKMVDLKGDGIPHGTCMVTRKLTKELMTQDWFIFKHWTWQEGKGAYGAEDSIAAGKRMGQILVHRLQVRNDPLMTKQTRLQTGGLDRRLLANLGMEITSVFQKSRVDIHKPAMLHLSLDASGSMHGRKWNKVRTVATALAYVGSKLRNVDVVISIRGGQDMPIVSIIFDSRKDQFPQFVKWMRVLEPNGATPEGLCFKATMDIITECTATHDVYFINFSDGQPAFVMKNTTAPGKAGRRNRFNSGDVYYQADLATRHTREMVNQMRDAGVKIMSYFITERADYYNTETMREFRKMYGDAAEHVDVKNATEILRTLNRLLLSRGG